MFMIMCRYYTSLLFEYVELKRAMKINDKDYITINLFINFIYYYGCSLVLYNIGYTLYRSVN